MSRLFKIFLLPFCLSLAFFQTGFSDIRLPKLISDGMVLQRDAPLKVWGWAYPGEKIQIIFMKETYQTVADENGNWSLHLGQFEAGGPYQMLLKGQNEVLLEDILIGDVWLCSGQSNMEINMQRVSPLYEKEIEEADFPEIRYFEVPKRYDFKTENIDFPGGSWAAVGQDNILSIPAISFFFARSIHERYDIPIGIISSALGGSPVEAWLSEDAIREFPKYYEELQRFKDDELIREIENRDAKIAAEWYMELNNKDKGYQGSISWSSIELEPENWMEIENPTLWKGTDLDGVNGSVWFRKDFELKEESVGRAANLNLGMLIDMDSVFLNGKFVGSTSYQYPPRRYVIPEGLLKKGKNTLVVRLISNIGEGGFVTEKPYELLIGNQKIDLTGTWKYQLGAIMEPLPQQTFIRWKPVGLFNAMISPLKYYATKGVLWYQGESNAERPEEYAQLFQSMIENWRTEFNQKDLPFLYVQLPNYLKADREPSESNWAKLREAQLQTLNLPHTAMAITIDIGEWNDIHPLNKKDVAYRLAILARKNVYGENELVSSGPIFRSYHKVKDKIILEFDHVGDGLIIQQGDKLKNFAIAGEDGKFIWADAKIENNHVVVWHRSIKNPTSLRYAWANNPEGINLYNKNGLPASPFRVDLE
ncbi:MAG: sialate O-acetylesterase [Mongoliibacter sp.]|uniref:sialate O-acetylesterase n=1 Tax=Mongoliibacter sp. TaxID=2022438 RepID=UPI0012F204DC|nr:sialate O-acetylesterase [Mongoliibacter sp.]TVP49644.1 MAG: sialate O-acetylesterase [Mongoliibacter sp.]